MIEAYLSKSPNPYKIHIFFEETRLEHHIHDAAVKSRKSPPTVWFALIRPEWQRLHRTGLDKRNEPVLLH